MTIKTACYGALVGAVLVVWVLSRRSPATPLPPALSQAVAMHDAERVVASAEVSRWRAAADSARRHERAAQDRAARAEANARKDSARVVALLAERQLPEALTAQSRETVTLRVAFAAETTAVRAADVRAAELDSGLTRSSAQARSADSLLAAVVRVARERPPPCRFVRVLPCPGRKIIAIGSAALGFALAKGWVGTVVGMATRGL